MKVGRGGKRWSAQPLVRIIVDGATKAAPSIDIFDGVTKAGSYTKRLLIFPQCQTCLVPHRTVHSVQC